MIKCASGKGVGSKRTSCCIYTLRIMHRIQTCLASLDICKYVTNFLPTSENDGRITVEPTIQSRASNFSRSGLHRPFYSVSQHPPVHPTHPPPTSKSPSPYAPLPTVLPTLSPPQVPSQPPTAPSYALNKVYSHRPSAPHTSPHTPNKQRTSSLQPAPPGFSRRTLY